MSLSNAKERTSQISTPLSRLLLCLLLVSAQTLAATTTQNAAIPKANATTIVASVAAVPTTPHFFVPHRYTSHDNITILHEVHEGDVDSETEKPIVLNTHEVLPLKPLKKKPYTLLEKTIIAEYEKPRPLKAYELHPVTFDFNLGDLEDLEHESIKKGDLSAEEKHLLRNGNDEGLTYTERTSEEAAVAASAETSGNVVGVSVVPTANSATSTTSSSTSTTTTTTAATNTPTAEAAVAAATSPPSVISVSPHIFKILKNKTGKKGRELLKKDDLHKSPSANNFNSISHHFDAEDLDGNDSADANTTAPAAESLHSANLFQLVTNLYDHFYWQASEIRGKVSTGCGLEMQAYLTALHGNFAWAQRAYDASGHYRGQFLYGNDKWLGQKIFCYELNRQLQPEERRHFEFEFYAALVALRLWMPQKVELTLQVGECLPKSCSSQDLHAILTLDPHAHMLAALGNIGSSASNNSTNSANATLVHIARVRTVPGIFNYWHELKFQIFASFICSLISLVIVATWYQSKLTERQLTASSCSPAATSISAKIDATVTSHNGGGMDAYTNNRGKAFELYQMNTLGSSGVAGVGGGDNNNVVEIESDVNGNMGGVSSSSECGGGGGGNTHSHKSVLSDAAVPDVAKAQMADYKMETSSSAGAGGTYVAKQRLGLHEQFLLCFAFQTNASAILNIDENKESQTSCVHGLRVLSVLWTIMVHTYLQVFTIGENRRIIVERSIWYQFVGNATFSVDTFFFISGFLVTLLYLKQEKKYPEHRSQYIRRSCKDTAFILIYRYIRLTPAYLFVIVFNDFSLRQTFDASVFQPTVAPNTCSQYWWRNILYINNFYPLSEICMIWSWYMANDMQLYIMASLLLVLSTRYFKTAVLTVSTFLLSSWGVSGIISLRHHYTHKVADPFESFDFLYDKPWQRVGTYIMGMLAGYVIFKVKSPPKISQRTNYLLWAASFGLLALIIFGVWDGELSEINTAFYVGVGHTAFGLGLIWIVLSCCWGLAPTMNRILSYRGLWPLSRLTYCTYLIHPLIMLITSFRMSGTVHLNNLFVMTIFLGNAVVSFGAAFFISVLFEAPVIRLLKICFRK